MTFVPPTVVQPPGQRSLPRIKLCTSRAGGPRQHLSVDGVAYASDQDHPLAMRLFVTPGYFGVFDVEPVRGRVFTRADGPDTLSVALVNERFVKSR